MANIYRQDKTLTIWQGDSRQVLPMLPEKSVHCCVTSPPYFRLRDYGVEGQIGLEISPEVYVAEMVNVFREVKRVLRDDGTLWLNIGDSYANDGKWGGHTSGIHAKALHGSPIGRNKRYTGLKPKDLIGIPWMLAFALRADGWWLRSEIIWHKPSAMPESVADRPTKSHEQIFLLTKSAHYYYDAEAIAEPCSPNTHARISQDVARQIVSARAHGGAKANGNMKAVVKTAGVNPKAAQNVYGSKQNETFAAGTCMPVQTRNKRTVWTVPAKGYSDAHFATFPPDLVAPCIKAGCPAGGTVLDPFAGSGTTLQVAEANGCKAVGIELNPDYCRLIEQRLRRQTLFATTF
jgi:DNA modification methylase